MTATMPTDVAALDAATPKWPVAVVNLSPPPTITISGVTTAITGTDVQAAAVKAAAKQAQAAGHPIRVRATTVDGWVQHLIVTAAGQVTLLGKPPAPRPVKAGGKAKPLPKRGVVKAPAGWKQWLPSMGLLAGKPAWFRWVLLGTAIVTVLALAVIVFHHKTPAVAATTPTGVAAPIPPAGQVYTETAPPGWSQHAAWVVPLAVKAPAPVTDRDTGFTAAVTPTDEHAPNLGPFDPGDLFLSALAADGHTVWAAPLDRVPALGPVLVRVDGQLVVAVATGQEVTYWPLTTGGEPTVVDLPSGIRTAGVTGVTSIGGSLLLTNGTVAGYIHDGALVTVDVLPLTVPVAATDQAVLMYQAKPAPTWWQVTAGAAPTRVTVPPQVATVVAPPAAPPKPVTGQLIPTGTTGTLLMVTTGNHLYALTKGN